MSCAAGNIIDTKLYRKSSQSLNKTVELDEETARVFAVLDGRIELSKAAELADVNMAVLWKAIAKLTRLGLVEGADDGAGFMGGPFVEAMQNEFAEAVGPISLILLKKTAAQLDISLPNIPVDRAQMLIQKLAEKIPDEQASTHFQRILSRDL